MTIDIAFLYIYSYLLGAIPTAYIIARLVKGIDIRKYGSGTVGGTNLWYHVGKKWVVPLGFFEILGKGASPLWVGHYVLDLDRSSFWLMGAGLVAIAAHNWSVFLGFKGGRGIAVVIGVLFGLGPWDPAIGSWEFVLFVGVALAGWLRFRASAVWVLISLALLPVWATLLGEPLAIRLLMVGILVLVIAKRLEANFHPVPPGLSKRRLFLNRLLLDRDVSSHQEWVLRMPGQVKTPRS